MSEHGFLPTLDIDGDGPLFARIAASVRRGILDGRLAEGRRLPGARSLAEALGVHRNTVTAAFEALDAEGWIRTEASRGRFVRVRGDQERPLEAPSWAQEGPQQELAPERAAEGPASQELASQGLAFELGPPPPIEERTPTPPGAFDMRGGLPDPRQIPWELLARAYRRVLKRRGPKLLDYGPPEGEPSLRVALAAMLADLRGLAVEADEIFVTRGSQMAIWLVASALVRPGDRVAIEAFGYGPAWDALRSHGARLHPIPVDEEGMRVEALEALLRQGRIRAVYLTPHHQYPTMATLSAPRRLRLLELAQRHGFALLEDDYDHEFHYEGRPVLPLASLGHGGSVVYLGTLSKILAPGLRVGYVVAPRALVERLGALRAPLDRQGDHAIEAAVAELIEEGELARHVWRMRRAYRDRRDAAVRALRRELGERIQVEPPNGGLALWAALDPTLDREAWRRRALERGVLFRLARELSYEGLDLPFARIGYSKLEPAEIEEAVRRLRQALP